MTARCKAPGCERPQLLEITVSAGTAGGWGMSWKVCGLHAEILRAKLDEFDPWKGS